MAHLFPYHLRTARIIQQIVAPVLLKLLPKGLITVREVKVSTDRRHAVIHYTVLGANPSEAHELLEKQIGYLRSVLAREMSSRRVPQLSLLQLPFDPSENLVCTVL